jgi:hypothetical protein
MTAADLMTIVREDFLFDVSNSVDGTDAEGGWSNDFILRQIGEAQRQACYRQDLRHLFDSTTEAICQIPLVAGTQSYALDPRILRIQSLVYDGTVLPQTTQARLDDSGRDWRNATSGSPRAFFVTGRTLTLDRPPGTGVLALEVWREPLATPAMYDELEWPTDQEKLGHWVAYRAFLRNLVEEDTVALSDRHLALFTMAFGAEVPAKARMELLAYPDLLLSPGYNEGWGGGFGRRSFDYCF